MPSPEHAPSDRDSDAPLSRDAEDAPAAPSGVGFGRGRLASLRSRWSKLDARQLGFIFAIVLASVYAFYLVVANALIVTGVIKDEINVNPEAFAVDYTSARTWFPGRLQIRNLTIRGRDDAIEWHLVVDSAVADIQLGELLRRHFHATRVRGDGIAFRLRRRLPPGAFTPKKARALPPIDGFYDPPLAPAVPHPSPSDEEYRLFTATLEDVVAEHVREVWIDMYRYAGDSRIAGSFHLKPIREVDLGASRVDIRSGTMILDGQPVLGGLAGTMDAAIRRFDPRDVHGAALLDQISLAIHADGTVEDARFLDFYTDGEPALAGGRGPAHVHVLLRDGVLEDGASIDVEGRSLTAKAGEYTVSADTHLRIEAKQRDDAKGSEDARRREGGAEGEDAGGRGAGAEPEPGGGVLVTARLDATTSIVRAGYPKAPIRTEGLVATARSADPKLSNGLEDLALSVACEEVDLPDVRVLASYADAEGMRVARGSGSASFAFHLTPRDGALRGEATAASRSLVDYEKNHVEGTFRADLRVPKGSLHTGVFDLTGSSVEVRDADAVGGEHDATKHWSGRVDLASASLRAGTLEAVARIQGRDARPLLSIAPLDLPDWVGGWLDTDGLGGSVHLRVGPSQLDADPVVLQAGSYHLEGRFHARDERSHGVFLVRKDFLSLGVELRDGAPKLIPLGASAWYRDHAR